MASEIRVNSINNRSGLGTVTIADDGLIVSGIVTASTFDGNVNATSGVTTVTGLNASNVVISGVTTVSAGSTSTPSITSSGDSNTGIFFPSADTIAFAEGGSEAARIDSSGRLLVGTSSGSALLQVNGTFRAGDSGGGGSGGNNATQLAATPPAGALMAEIMCVGNYYAGTPNTHTGFLLAYWSSYTNTITTTKDVNHSAGSNQGFVAIWSGTQVVVRNKTSMSSTQGGQAFIRWLA